MREGEPEQTAMAMPPPMLLGFRLATRAAAPLEIKTWRANAKKSLLASFG